MNLAFKFINSSIIIGLNIKTSKEKSKKEEGSQVFLGSASAYLQAENKNTNNLPLHSECSPWFHRKHSDKSEINSPMKGVSIKKSSVDLIDLSMA